MSNISVIVPVYKVEPYLRRCVDSILNQTYTDFELILVDDGSPDGCSVLCDEYALKDSRIHVIHQPNGGVSSARNAGLDIAQEEYITFVDSDDWISGDFLQYTYDLCLMHGVDLLICGFAGIDNEENTIYESLVTNRISANDGVISPEDRESLLRTGYISSPWGKLFRRSCIGLTRFDETMCYGEDLQFVYTILQSNLRLLAMPVQKYYYRDTPGSLTKVVTKRRYECVRRIYDLLLKDNFSRYGKRKNPYKMFVMQRLFFDYHYCVQAVLSGKIDRRIECLRGLFSSGQIRHIYEGRLLLSTAAKIVKLLIGKKKYGQLKEMVEKII